MIEINKYLEAQILIKALNGKQEEISKYEDEMKNIKRATTQRRFARLNKVYWLSALSIFIFIAAYCLIVPNFVNMMIGTDESFLSRFFFICIVIGNAIALVFGLFYVIILDKAFKNFERRRELTEEEKSRYTQCDALIFEAKSMIDGIVEQLKESNIPQKYLCEYALNWMIDAIQNQLVDSPKELYNLYERFVVEERRHMESLHAISNIQVYNEYNYWG